MSHKLLMSVLCYQGLRICNVVFESFQMTVQYLVGTKACNSWASMTWNWKPPIDHHMIAPQLSTKTKTNHLMWWLALKPQWTNFSVLIQLAFVKRLTFRGESRQVRSGAVYHQKIQWQYWKEGKGGCLSKSTFKTNHCHIFSKTTRLQTLWHLK